MTYTEQAIQKAIEGGYVTGFIYDKLSAIDPCGAIEILLLDPKWWKCLGKALGKENEMMEFAIWRNIKDSENETWWWIAQWHMLVDHIAEGYSVEDYFKSILSK